MHIANIIAVIDLNGLIIESNDELSKLARLKKWNDMRKLITDSMLEEFEIISKPSKILDQIRSKYSNLLDRVTLYIPLDRNKIFWEKVLKNRI